MTANTKSDRGDISFGESTIVESHDHAKIRAGDSLEQAIREFALVKNISEVLINDDLIIYS